MKLKKGARFRSTPLNPPTRSVIVNIDLSSCGEDVVPVHWQIQGGARDAPPGGPNSFIFMQFSTKKLQNNSTVRSWRTPSGKSWIRHCCYNELVREGSLFNDAKEGSVE